MRVNATRTGLAPAASSGSSDGGRFRDPTQQREREDQPPHGDADEGQLDGGDGVGQPERGGAEDPGQVEQQDDAAAEEADGEAGRGDTVDLVRPRDVRQQ